MQFFLPDRSSSEFIKGWIFFGLSIGFTPGWRNINCAHNWDNKAQFKVWISEKTWSVAV